MKITSKLIKLILMYKYRYKDGFMVTSECMGHGDGIADIITYDLNKKSMIEIEIKISKQDLKKDIKKIKHTMYRDRDNTNIQKFYYAVPTFLVEYTREFLIEHDLNYGIIEIITYEVEHFEFKYFANFEKLMRVEKRCTRFNKNEPSDRQVYAFMKRISSELVSREQELFLLNNGFNKK
jgi:hypothetical protein